jgi:hypothetical protein
MAFRRWRAAETGRRRQRPRAAARQRQEEAAAGDGPDISTALRMPASDTGTRAHGSKHGGHRHSRRSSISGGDGGGSRGEGRRRTSHAGQVRKPELLPGAVPAVVRPEENGRQRRETATVHGTGYHGGRGTERRGEGERAPGPRNATADGSVHMGMDAIETNVHDKRQRALRTTHHRWGVERTCVFVIDKLPDMLEKAREDWKDSRDVNLGCEELTARLQHHMPGKKMEPTTVSIAREQGIDSNWAVVTMQDAHAVEQALRDIGATALVDLPSDSGRRGQRAPVRASRYNGGRGRGHSGRAVDQMDKLLLVLSPRHNDHDRNSGLAEIYLRFLRYRHWY